MRLASVFASTIVLAVVTAIALPSAADAQTRRKPTKLTVTPKSYLVLGKNYPPKTSYDYAADIRYRSTAPAPHEMGPGGGGSFTNLPGLFEVPGQRPMPF